MTPAKARTTWIEKTRRLLGGDAKDLPRGAVAKLADLLGEDPRMVRYWLVEGRSPRREAEKIRAVALALGVDAGWLDNGEDTPVVRRGLGIPEEVAQRVPVKFRRLIYAVADPRCAEYLLSQLDVWERTMRAPPERKPA